MGFRNFQRRLPVRKKHIKVVARAASYFPGQLLLWFTEQFRPRILKISKTHFSGTPCFSDIITVTISNYEIGGGSTSLGFSPNITFVLGLGEGLS